MAHTCLFGLKSARSPGVPLWPHINLRCPTKRSSISQRKRKPRPTLSLVSFITIIKTSPFFLFSFLFHGHTWPKGAWGELEGKKDPMELLVFSLDLWFPPISIHLPPLLFNRFTDFQSVTRSRRQVFHFVDFQPRGYALNDAYGLSKILLGWQWNHQNPSILSLTASVLRDYSSFHSFRRLSKIRWYWLGN